MTSPLDSFLHLITETQTAFKSRDETDLILNYRVIGTQTEHYIGLSVAYLERLHEKVTFVTLHANYRLVVGTKETFKKKLVHLVFHVALINR